MEVTDKDPYLIEGIRHSGEQTKGACLVPKRALNVMQGEVNRILQLTSTSVIPVTYQVPRKTYRLIFLRDKMNYFKIRKFFFVTGIFTLIFIQKLPDTLRN